jgi:hypothetical protein
MKCPRERDEQWVMVDSLNNREIACISRERNVGEFTGGGGGASVVDSEYGELSSREEGCEMEGAG